MFDIGWSELLIIGIVALIVIGPKELPAVLRTVGQYMTKVRRMASEFQGQFQEAMREAEMADLKKHVDDITGTAQDYTSFDPLGDIQKDFETALEDKPRDATTTAHETPAPEAASPEAAAQALPAPVSADTAFPQPALEPPASADVAVVPQAPQPKDPATSGSGA